MTCAVDAMTVDELAAWTRALLAAARADVNTFVEVVLQDGAGAPLKQAELHRQGQRFMTETIAAGGKALMLWPREHGKSVQVMARMAWEIGRAYCPQVKDARMRFGTVRYYTNPGVSDVRTKFLRSIITSPVYQAVFPGVLLDGNKDSADGFNLVGNTSLNWTFTAQPMTSSKAGGRATLLGVLDDVVDATSMESPAHRAMLLERWNNDVANILSCPTLGIGTRWHRDDLWSEFLKHDSWRAMIVSAAEAAETGTLGVTWKPVSESILNKTQGGRRVVQSSDGR